MADKIFLSLAIDIMPGHKKRFVVGAEKIMVANIDGEYFGVQDTCSHAQASLTAGKLIGCEIECPLHGARFDVRTGEVKVLPAVIPLRKYQIIVEDEKLYLLL